MTTGSDGVAVIPVTTSLAVELQLKGSFSDIVNTMQARAEESVTLQEGVPKTFEWDDSNATIVERNVYQAQQRVRQWMLALAPDLEWLQTQVLLFVGEEGECNALWDGVQAYFFRESDTCNDTGRIADIVYHEMGHGFHQFLRVAGVWDFTVSEGSGDYIAATITGDPIIAPTFYKASGTAHLRELENTLVYPDDFVDEVHADGMIWGGALWDLRVALIEEYGETLGVQKTDEIFVGALRGGPTLVDGYWEVLFADDDDADLSNGTPHVCQISDSFGAHGLGPGVGGGFVIDHVALGHQQPSQPVSIQAKVSSNLPQCGGLDPSTVALKWRYEGAEVFSTLEMPVVPGIADEFEALIPEMASGAKVEYYLQAGSGVALRTDPPGAPEKTFSFYVGDMLTVFHDDFENGEGEWTHGSSQAESEVADDWQLGTPVGLSGDPDQAFSGQNVWGNDLGSDSNGSYPADVTNYLESPVINCLDYGGVRLQFRRWLTVEDGDFDQARIRVNGETVWSNAAGWGTLTHLDKNWFFHDIDISKWADQTKFKLRFELESDGDIEKGGWNIDDVVVVVAGKAPKYGCQCRMGGDPSGRGAGRVSFWALCVFWVLAYWIRLRRFQAL